MWVNVLTNLERTIALFHTFTTFPAQFSSGVAWASALAHSALWPICTTRTPFRHKCTHINTSIYKIQMYLLDCLRLLLKLTPLAVLRIPRRQQQDKAKSNKKNQLPTVFSFFLIYIYWAQWVNVPLIKWTPVAAAAATSSNWSSSSSCDVACQKANAILINKICGVSSVAQKKFHVFNIFAICFVRIGENLANEHIFY